MKRAALMPFTGDPFLLAVWLDFYKRIWRSEVDHCIILFNTDNLPDDVIYANIKQMESANVQYIVSPTRINHGPGIDILLAALFDAKPEHVVLLEEDAFVFKAGHIDSAFQLLESGQCDVVAGRRGSCSNWLIELGKQLWGTEDHGPNFWPNFFFSSYNLLINTDRNFGAKTWQPGEVVFKLQDKHFDNIEYQDKYKPGSLWINNLGDAWAESEELTVGDTFVNTSLQIRTKIRPDRIVMLPQYHCSPNDLYDYTGHTEYQHCFDGQCYWLHVGSLSSWQSFILSPNIPDKVAANAEYERRIAFWKLFALQASKNKENPCLPVKFWMQYMNRIEQLTQDYGLSAQDINKRVEIYTELMYG